MKATYPRSNTRIVLSEYVSEDVTDGTFRVEETAVPSPQEGEVLVRTQYLSLDPYMRNRLVDSESYATGVERGQVIVGESVGTVIESRSPLVPEGSTVIGFGGWQEYFTASADSIRVLPEDDAVSPPDFLGVLGMPGFTAWICLTQVAQLIDGDTLLVPAASGPVGLVLGQIGKLMGARCIGVVGGPERTARLQGLAVFDEVLDRRDPNFARMLAAVCPSGIDVYVDTVGGDVLTAATALMNVGGRIPLVGTIADYRELQSPSSFNLRPSLTRAILVKRLRVQGVLVYDFAPLRHEFERTMAMWLREGLVRLDVEVHHGIGSAPDAFRRLLAGAHTAKIIIDLRADSAAS